MLMYIVIKAHLSLFQKTLDFDIITYFIFFKKNLQLSIAKLERMRKNHFFQV